MSSQFIVLDINNLELVDAFIDRMAARIKTKDTREWVCEADMVRMITGNPNATLSAPVIRRYRKEIQCKKEGKSWIYSTGWRLCVSAVIELLMLNLKQKLI